MRPTRMIACACLATALHAQHDETVRGPGPTLGETIPFEVRRLAVSPNEGCAIGDVDRDGDLDVVAGPWWFAAPDFVPRPLREVPEVGGGAYLANNGEHLVDVDGDGWLDVVAGSFFEPELRWYRNPGADALRRGLRWAPALLGKAGAANEATLARDLDGDGRPELIVDSWLDQAALLGFRIERAADGDAPVGADSPRARTLILGARGSGHGLGFGDVDGDGDEDIVCKIGWYERPAGDAALRAPWRLHRDFDLGSASCPVLVVDVDEDGRSDLVVGSAHGYGLTIHRQLEPVDGVTSWERRAVDRSVSQLHTLAWVDLTASGRPGVLTGKRVRAHEGADPGSGDPTGLWFYERRAADGAWTRRALGGTEGVVGTGLQIRTADLDGDGRLDVAVSGKTGTFVLFQRSPPR